MRDFPFRGAWNAVLAVAVCGCCLCGCNRGPSLSEIEAKERSSRLYRDAMDDLQAGRMEAAIKRFQRVVQEEPKSYSAHFQLATLLQDVSNDYILAIAHYRNYLALRPASDKATVAEDRMKLCETLLRAKVLSDAGGSASNELASQNDKLTAERDGLQKQVAKIETELEKARKTITRLETENASKSRLLEKLGEAVDGTPAKAPALKDALAQLKEEKAEVERRRLRPTDAELLDDDDAPAPDPDRRVADLKAAKALAQDAESAPQPPVAVPAAKAAAAAKPLPGAKAASGKMGGGAFDALAGAKKAKTPAAGARPETYTVQEGDTLFKISTRFYGSSHKWRDIQDANRAIIPANGRVRSGQVLKLP